MIITQTPLRVGLVGGGTDFPDFYREHGGRVLNAAIDKYVYVVVKQRFDDDIYINYSQKEIVSRVEDIRHQLVREAMNMAGIRGGVEITTLADIPSAGSGLGSSSSVTVGLLHALFTYQGVQLSAEELAQRACTIELDRCQKPIGKQDQYAAAYGGICDLRRPRGPRHRGPDPARGASAPPPPGRADALLQRDHAECRRDPAGADLEHRAEAGPARPVRDLADGASDALRRGDEQVGVAIRKSWEAKRELASGVSNSLLDSAMDAATDAGATGAKVAGAGGGGFVLVICPVQRQAAVRSRPRGHKGYRSRSIPTARGWCSMCIATSGLTVPVAPVRATGGSRARSGNRNRWRRPRWLGPPSGPATRDWTPSTTPATSAPPAMSVSQCSAMVRPASRPRAPPRAARSPRAATSGSGS